MVRIGPPTRWSNASANKDTPSAGLLRIYLVIGIYYGLAAARIEDFLVIELSKKKAAYPLVKFIHFFLSVHDEFTI